MNTLERIGISRDLLQLGNVVEIGGSPGRNGRTIMYADSIISAAGEASALNVGVNERYGRDERGSSHANDLFRVWVPVRVPSTGSGRVEFPLTESARAARAARCVAPGLPAAMDNPYPVALEIVWEYVAGNVIKPFDCALPDND